MRSRSACRTAGSVKSGCGVLRLESAIGRLKAAPRPLRQERKPGIGRPLAPGLWHRECQAPPKVLTNFSRNGAHRHHTTARRVHAFSWRYGHATEDEITSLPRHLIVRHAAEPMAG